LASATPIGSGQAFIKFPPLEMFLAAITDAETSLPPFNPSSGWLLWQCCCSDYRRW